MIIFTTEEVQIYESTFLGEKWIFGKQVEYRHSSAIRYMQLIFILAHYLI